jgi:hypothetical protein
MEQMLLGLVVWCGILAAIYTNTQLKRMNGTISPSTSSQVLASIQRIFHGTVISVGKGKNTF